MKNYIKLKKFSLFKNYYVFVDTKDYLADQIFIRNKVKVDFGEEASCEDYPKYVVIFCKIKKKDNNKFLKSLEELERKMLILGHTDYGNICQKIQDIAYGKMNVTE